MRKTINRLRRLALGSDRLEQRKYLLFSLVGFGMTGFMFSGFVMTLVNAIETRDVEAFYLPAALALGMSAVTAMHIYMDELYRSLQRSRDLNDCFLDPFLDLGLTSGGANLILATDPAVAAVSVEIPKRPVAVSTGVS